MNNLKNHGYQPRNMKIASDSECPTYLFIIYFFITDPPTPQFSPKIELQHRTLFT
jgi:hypothetical protein